MTHSAATEKPAAVSAHTPGPWYPGHFIDPASKCQCRGIVDENHGGGIAVVNVDNGKPLGDGGNDCPPLEEARANARLIAAAPDLLEACKPLLSKDARELIEGAAEAEWAVGSKKLSEILRLILDGDTKRRAAIARAEGR